MTVGEKLLNLTVELSGIVLCALAVLWVQFSKIDRQTRRHFLLFYSALLLFTASNIAGLLIRGLPGTVWRAALYASNFTEFLMSTVLAYVVLGYLLSIVDPKKKRRTLRIFLCALQFFHALLLLFSQFTGFCYYFDENNIYRRGVAYPLTYVASSVSVCIGMYLLLRCRNALTWKERAAFWAYFAVPSVAIVLQNMRYGINFVIFSTIIAGVAMYIFVVSDQTERYHRQWEENARLRSEIMLSQVQPHFLVNALGAIGQLCHDAPEARDALRKFSRYLQGNMNSLSQTEPIPFGTELEHTKAYLELEQLRFGEKLNVTYDLQAVDFLLPTLTLQPLVENAVRHGVRSNADGRGTVAVASREYPDHWEITVEDDGRGFDPAGLPDDGQPHIGLQNVRERLRRIGGALRIVSAPAQGCQVTITLPKEASDADLRD